MHFFISHGLGQAVKESPLKTKNAYRQIIVAPEVIQMLRERKEREDSFSIYVFSSPTGGPMCPDSMLKMLHRVLKRAGLEEIPFHALRHTFATLALQNGVDVKTLSGLLVTTARALPSIPTGILPRQ